MHDIGMCMSQIRHNDLQPCHQLEGRKALQADAKLCVSRFCPNPLSNQQPQLIGNNDQLII